MYFKYDFGSAILDVLYLEIKYADNNSINT